MEGISPVSPTFLKWRMIAFCWTSLASLLYIIMLSVIMYSRWQFFDRGEKSCVIVLVLVNTINVVALPILIIRQFRVWLDAARMMLLLMINIGIAGFFSYYNSHFECPDSTPDAQGNCQLLNMCILMASWISPALLVTYSACLAFWVWWRSRRSEAESNTSNVSIKFDEEATIGQSIPVLPSQTTMRSRRPPLTITIPPSIPNTATVLSQTPFPETCTTERDPSQVTRDRKKSLSAESVRSARPPMSARLSKQRPNPNLH